MIKVCEVLKPFKDPQTNNVYMSGMAAVTDERLEQINSSLHGPLLKEIGMVQEAEALPEAEAPPEAEALPEAEAPPKKGRPKKEG